MAIDDFVMSGVPAFVPHPLLRGGHAQTIAGRFLLGGSSRLATTYHEVALPDGDRLSVLHSVPSGVRPDTPVALLVHGLAGCARSPYVVRVGARLVREGFQVVRMNLRGAGSGFGAASRFYHAGCTEDLRAVAGWIHARSPGAPLALLGFSLGGNLVLKLAAEASRVPVPGLDCVLAANPPIDLAVCSDHLRQRGNRHYDRHFTVLLRREVVRLHEALPHLGPVSLDGIESVLDFDERITAPRNGFRDAADYYAQSSAGPLLPRVRIPGLVVHAEDDPFIPACVFRDAVFPDDLKLELLAHGGHLGYVSRNRWAGDRRWLDARLSHWLAQRWAASRMV
jgi:predicted alpha/beta-fold hydrolase